MIEIKICGITRLEDALAACESGADAVGFIFYENSPRYMTAGSALEIVKKLPQALCKVGVFVDHALGDLLEIASYCRLDLVQLHGNESREYAGKLPASRWIRAIRPRVADDLRGISDEAGRAVLIDAAVPGSYGGTGTACNWDLACRIRRADRSFRLILAGGLNPETIAAALTTVRPDAVDISSGVETAPREKDPVKIRRLVETVRTAGQQTKRADGKEKIFQPQALENNFDWRLKRGV